MRSVPSGASRQATLASLFVAFLVLSFAIVGWSAAERYLAPKEWTDLIAKILVTYSVPLGVIIGGYFGSAQVTTPAALDGRGFWLAISLCAIWNILFFGGVMLFAISAASMNTVSLADSSPYKDLNNFIDALGKYGSFLIGGTLAFYFTSDRSTSPK